MFLAIVLGAALQAACSASTNLSYVRGERWTVNVSECDLKELPRWSEADEAPPLSPRKAIQAARTLLRTLVADADSWRLDAVRLKPLGQVGNLCCGVLRTLPGPRAPHRRTGATIEHRGADQRRSTYSNAKSVADEVNAARATGGTSQLLPLQTRCKFRDDRASACWQRGCS